MMEKMINQSRKRFLPFAKTNQKTHAILTAMTAFRWLCDNGHGGHHPNPIWIFLRADFKPSHLEFTEIVSGFAGNFVHKKSSKNSHVRKHANRLSLLEWEEIMMGECVKKERATEANVLRGWGRVLLLNNCYAATFHSCFALQTPFNSISVSIYYLFIHSSMLIETPPGPHKNNEIHILFSIFAWINFDTIKRGRRKNGGVEGEKHDFVNGNPCEKLLIAHRLISIWKNYVVCIESGILSLSHQHKNKLGRRNEMERGSRAERMGKKWNNLVFNCNK